MLRPDVRRALLFASAAAALLLACNSSPPRREQPKLDSTSSELRLNLGEPCNSNVQCAPPPGVVGPNGFCVDTVCCDTTCGGGARDNFACSNVYGDVTHNGTLLVPGTCTELLPGDPCGVLEGSNPCTWRGTTLNGGHNCPAPNNGTPLQACYTCDVTPDCPPGLPICINHGCTPCVGDFGSGGPSACPTQGFPICIDGGCVECTPQMPGQCQGNTGTCDPATNSCVGCDGDFGPPTTPFECNMSKPVCVLAGPDKGLCHECSATNLTACTVAKPLCDATGTCVACTSSAQCGGSTPVCSGGTCVGCDATHACPDPAAPACLPNGMCVQCTTANSTACVAPKPLCDDASNMCVECLTTADCTGPNGICNPLTHMCTTGCTSDANCSVPLPACKIMDPAGLCVECTATNQTMCTGAKPICNLLDNTCVGCTMGSQCPGDKPVCDPQTKTCTAECTLSSQCPGDMPVCDPVTKRCVDCITNADCMAPTPICNTITHMCGSECTLSSQCPADLPVCDPVTKMCVDCITNADCMPPTPICNTVTHMCGTECTKSAECPGDVPICDPKTKKCVECTDNTMCKPPNPICNPVTMKCGTDCSKNSDCPASAPFCDPSTKKCGPAPVTPPVTPPTGAAPEEFSVEGAGCNCSTVPSGGTTNVPALLGLGLALAAVTRRRRK